MEVPMSHHDELLALAGQVPDGWLATAREVLAEGDLDRLAELRAAIDTRIADTPRRFRFFPELRGHEAADHAVVGTVSAMAGTEACWATMRMGADRVYLVQVGANADPAAVTDRAQRVLSDVEESPRVEVFAADASLPRYHEDALLASDLLWARDPVPSISVARSFDGADPGGPWFGAGRELVVDPEVRQQLLDYLKAGEVVLTATNRLPDVIAGVPDAVPADLLSDGTWVWSAATVYYLDRHQVAPDPALEAHAKANRAAGRLTPLARYYVRAALSPIGGVAA
jgi:hypothetical protein